MDEHNTVNRSHRHRGGPAGLTAAYELADLTFIPKCSRSRVWSEAWRALKAIRGFHFDLGVHRFFTKAKRSSKCGARSCTKTLSAVRVFPESITNENFFYPLKPFNALLGWASRGAIRIIASYVWWHFPHRHEDTFERWVTNRFGKRRLFLTFFKTYTKKSGASPAQDSRLSGRHVASKICR